MVFKEDEVGFMEVKMGFKEEKFEIMEVKLGFKEHDLNSTTNRACSLWNTHTMVKLVFSTSMEVGQGSLKVGWKSDNVP